MLRRLRLPVGSRLISPLRMPVRFNSDSPKAEPKAEATPQTEGSQIEELTKQLAKKDHEIAEIKDLYIRALADAENVRHRTQKEIKDKEDYALTKFAKDLLNTADILSMALDAVPESERGETATHPELKNLYTGVSMTRKELTKVLEKYGIVAYDPKGHEFDFNLHTAIFQSDMPDMKPGTVFHVDKIGYKIKDRVLRPASVGVVKEKN